MSAIGEIIARPAGRQAVPARWPVLAPLSLLVIALLLRIIDIFGLRLDERLGEIILSKTLGFALVLGYTWWVGQRVTALGLHTRHLGVALALGTAITVVAFVVAGAVQVALLPPGATLTLQAVDPKTGLSGGGAFATLLVVGNIVNSFMEEGLFRGIMLTHFLRWWRFGAANLLQAVLFAAWHLVWPLKAYLTGDASTASIMAQTGSLLLGTFVAALVYGFLFRRTDSLWAPWIAHFLNNTTLNLVQVQAANGELQPAVVMSVVVVIALAFLALGLSPIAKRWPLPCVQPWSALASPRGQKRVGEAGSGG
jgi:membrane protease YdiL (CAAX protease family)